MKKITIVLVLLLLFSSCDLTNNDDTTEAANKSFDILMDNAGNKAIYYSYKDNIDGGKEESYLKDNDGDEYAFYQRSEFEGKSAYSDEIYSVDGNTLQINGSDRFTDRNDYVYGEFTRLIGEIEKTLNHYKEAYNDDEVDVDISIEDGYYVSKGVYDDGVNFTVKINESGSEFILEDDNKMVRISTKEEDVRDVTIPE